MKFYWISWYTPKELGGFNLKYPWWVTGHRLDPNDSVLEKADVSVTPTVCAAVQAKNEAGARDIIKKSYDKEPVDLEWRFCEERPDDWIPFNERFPKSGWMTWPPEKDKDANT